MSETQGNGVPKAIFRNEPVWLCMSCNAIQRREADKACACPQDDWMNVSLRQIENAAVKMLQRQYERNGRRPFLYAAALREFYGDTFVYADYEELADILALRLIGELIKNEWLYGQPPEPLPESVRSQLYEIFYERQTIDGELHLDRFLKGMSAVQGLPILIDVIVFTRKAAERAAERGELGGMR